MKKLFLATAVLAIAGCSQNEITKTAPGTSPGIDFNVYTGVQTRGTELTTTGLQAAGAGFDVAGVYKDKVYLKTRHVTYNETTKKWTYTPLAYWPADGSDVTFYAYAPHGGEGITKTSFETVAPSLDFSIQSDWKKMVDLVKAEATAKSGEVTLSFKHILTRINFTASTEAELPKGAKAFITSLKVDQATSPKFYQSGTYTYKGDAWSKEVPLAKSADYPIISTDTEVSSHQKTAPTKLLGDKNYLFCLPVSGLAANEIKLKVEYKLTYADGTESKNTKEISIPAGHFAKGKAYVYNFEIGMKAITFSTVSVENWEAETPTDMNL